MLIHLIFLKSKIDIVRYHTLIFLEKQEPMINACGANESLVFTILNATEISSPGFYAKVYPANLNCTWKFKGSKNKRINLVFDDLYTYEIEEK